MKENGVWWFGIAICLSVIAFSNLSERHKDLILQRLRLRGRKISSAETPPRSLSPKKDESKAKAPSSSEYADVFPPSQRGILQALTTDLSAAQRSVFGDLDFDQTKFEDSVLKFEQHYRTADPSTYSYSGFSVQEIKALGDFPDYATLSEVPLPKPYVEFDIGRAKPRPYRPFRWAYHQTMSLTKMEPDWWLELENTYKDRIAQRQQLYATEGKGVLQWLPGSELACKELMEMVLQFLCARYPQYFRLSNDNTVFENDILGTRQALNSIHPLIVLLDNVPEDFAIMLRNPETGQYHFRAGVICSALGWNLGSKIGMQLHEIHQPIPDYKEKMKFSMDRFFTKMPTTKPIQRGSWGLEVDQPLYMPPGDPHEKYRDYQAPELNMARCHLRVDWQTLRRLPLSGAVVFNFKGLFTPIAEFRDEPYIPALVLRILNEGKKNLMEYKNTWHVEHVVKPALEEWAKEQEDKGLVEKNWEVTTLDDAPYFPGWREKWHRQQGF